MSSIDDAVMNDKEFWQEPKPGQPFGINYWIVPYRNEEADLSSDYQADTGTNGLAETNDDR